MSNDTLPVTFRSSPRTGLVAVGIGVLVVAVGILKLTDDTGNEFFGPIQVSGSTAGWLFAVAGAVIVLVGLVALVRRCPSLTLGEAGIVYTPCVGALVEVGWSQLTDVTVRHATVAGTRGRRGASFESVYLATSEGRHIGLGNVGEARQVADTIRRLAARRAE